MNGDSIMCKAIVTDKFLEFKSKVKEYATASGAESFSFHNDGDIFTATVYGLHKVKLFKRPGEKTITARIYLGDRNVKTVVLK